MTNSQPRRTPEDLALSNWRVGVLKIPITVAAMGTAVFGYIEGQNQSIRNLISRTTNSALNSVDTGSRKAFTMSSQEIGHGLACQGTVSFHGDEGAQPILSLTITGLPPHENSLECIVRVDLAPREHRPDGLQRTRFSETHISSMGVPVGSAILQMLKEKSPQENGRNFNTGILLKAGDIATTFSQLKYLPENEQAALYDTVLAEAIETEERRMESAVASKD
jgi:hypothetical protein